MIRKENKIIGILVITLLFLAIIPVSHCYEDKGVTESIIYQNTEVLNTIVCDDNGTEVIDQENIDSFRKGKAFKSPSFVYAQSFKPTLTKMTKVELYLWKLKGTPGDWNVSCSVRYTKNHHVLASSTVSSKLISDTGTSWITFDFDEIDITPERTYYIVVNVNGGTEDTHINWAYGLNNPYDRGSAWGSSDNGGYWVDFEQELSGYVDFCFRTYGLDYPPEPPIIDGPVSAGYNKEYTYTFNTNDLEENDVFYFVDWGDETNTSWIGPYPSGTLITLNHSFFYHSDTAKQCIIRAKAKNVYYNGIRYYDIVGDWGTLEVSMPKNKISNMNTLFQRFFELLEDRFPCLILLLS